MGPLHILQKTVVDSLKGKVVQFVDKAVSFPVDKHRPRAKGHKGGRIGKKGYPDMVHVGELSAHGFGHADPVAGGTDRIVGTAFTPVGRIFL